MRSWLSEYLAAQHREVDSIPLDQVEQVIGTVRRVWREDRRIFAIGNVGNRKGGES